MRGKFYKLTVAFVLLILLSAAFPHLKLANHAKADATTWYANSSAADGGNGSAGSPFNTFAAAYNAASSGDTINLTGTFDWSNAGETGDALTSGFTVTKSLTIQGQSASDTIIQAASAANTADRRIFTFATGGTSVTLEDLTIRYGYHGGGQATAISASSMNLTILRTIVTENTSSSTYQSGGSGAITFSGSGASYKFIMRNSTVSDNGNLTTYNNYTGGMYIGSTTAANEITNCTFYHNSGAYNGAIYARGYLTVTNSTFVANRGTVSGTDIHSFAEGRIWVKNSIFADKYSGGVSNLVAQSGGVFYDGGYNIVETQSSAGFVNGVNGNLVGDQPNLYIDSALADNNALYHVPTLALTSADSVAVNAADPADGANNGISIPTEDQRGAARPDATDIGAYEYDGLIDIPEPTVQASDLVLSDLSYNKVTATWAAGDGSRRAVFVKNTASDTALPADGSSYTAGASFGSGSQIGSTGWYCVYSGSGTTVDITGLLSEHNYIVAVFEYNGTIAGTQNYLTTVSSANSQSATTDSVSTPTVQSSAVTFPSVGSTSMDVSWTSGDGTSRVVFAKAGSSGTATPVNLTTYSANATFGSGSQISSSGWYAVYNGSGTSVTVTGLSLSTPYRFQVIEYNGDATDEHFLTTTATDNPKTQATNSRPDGENFETGDFTNFDWTFGGTATGNQWTTTTSSPNAGTYCAKAGAYHETSKNSYIEVTLDVLEAGNISFYKKVSSESCCDKLYFYINGVQPASSTWSGTVAWSQSTFPVTIGEHTFKWLYAKDGSVDSGSDTAWLDDIVFPKINPTSYSLEYIAGNHGTIVGNDYQMVNEGGDGSEVEAVADTGYHFTSWDDLLGDNPRTDRNASASISVTANFVINTYSLSYGTSAPGPGSSTGHGTISGSSNQTVDWGGNGSAVTAMPDIGYHFVRWSDNSTSNPRTDSNVTSAVSVYAIFSINSYILSYSAGTGGTVSGSTNQVVNYGESGPAVMAVADSGYEFTNWSDGSASNPRIDANITSDISVSAVFSAASSGSSSSQPSPSNKSRSVTSETINQDEISRAIEADNKDAVENKTGSYIAKAYNKDGQILLSEIRFRVVDGNNNPLVGVLVYLHSSVRQTLTDSNGYAIFKDVEAGDHKIEVAYLGRKVSKQVAIFQPEVMDQEVTMQPIEIVVSSSDLPWWGYVIIIFVLTAIIYKFAKKSRAKKSRIR